ncbi:MAG TPA: hypothetical protein VH796_07365 [Nitrososphaeraceae archaeon]|jgi:hypothetical protein
MKSISNQFEKCISEAELNKYYKMRRMQYLSQKEVIECLGTKKAYTHKISKIITEETHISWIFLTGSYAYKIKKSLKFGKILDFSSLELRKKSCQKEVKLNRILCGNMYIGVVKIVDKNNDSILRISNLQNKGKPLEYAVKMREISQQCRLDHLLSMGYLSFRTIEKLAKVLTKFHIHTVTSKEIQRYGQPEFINAKIYENFNTIAKITKVAKVNLNLEKVLTAFVIDNNNLFLDRIRENKVRDIHGDLHLKNIFIVRNKFYLYDRIEFNDSLRYADVAEDVAHLSMDLDYYKRIDFRKYFISQYIRKSNDLSLERVIYFWMCFKACVRAKVSLFRGKNETVKEKRNRHLDEAKDLFILARSYIKFL